MDGYGKLDRVNELAGVLLLLGEGSEQCLLAFVRGLEDLVFKIELTLLGSCLVGQLLDLSFGDE